MARDVIFDEDTRKLPLDVLERALVSSRIRFEGVYRSGSISQSLKCRVGVDGAVPLPLPLATGACVSGSTSNAVGG